MFSQLCIKMRVKCLFAVWSGKDIHMKTEHIKRENFSSRKRI